MSYQTGNACIPIEDAAQSKVANSETWLLAKQVNFAGDSKPGLEAIGFTVGNERGLFYEVIPPSGYTKSTEGYWTYVLNDEGKEVLNQFYKAAPWDTEAFLNFATPAQ